MLDEWACVVVCNVPSKSSCCSGLSLVLRNDVVEPVFICRDRILGKEGHEFSITPCHTTVARVPMLEILFGDLVDGNVGLLLSNAFNCSRVPSLLPLSISTH